MKCAECGAAIHAYREIRQLIMNEMGITKDDVKKQIDETIRSIVNGAIDDNLHTFVVDAVHRRVFELNDSGVMKRFLQNAFSKHIEDTFDFEVVVKGKEER